jgi:methionine sulfoxide reductase heme-binding subunit
MTTWVLLRAAGIGAYLMLFLSVAWGLLATTSLVTARVSKRAATMFHGFVASAGLALLVVHLLLLIVDRFFPFGPLDLVVPFASAYRPVPVGLGVVAMYATVAIVVTSWLRKRVGTAWWRRVHVLAVPTFAITLLHGVFAGTDTERPWMLTVYAATGLSIVFLVVVRGLTHGFRPAPHAVAA